MFDAARDTGAALYVPADNKNLFGMLSGKRSKTTRTLIACTEDAVSEANLPFALDNLRNALAELPTEHPNIYVRCRNPQVLDQLLDISGIEKVVGFVLPKADEYSLEDYDKRLRDLDFAVMPTLETQPATEPHRLRSIRDFLLLNPIGAKVSVLRIGGNDLLRLLGLRRQRGVTLYDTPLGHIAYQMLWCFKSDGFELSSPVYDFFQDNATLQREAHMDAAAGFVGKTAIHPHQVRLIDEAWRVSDADWVAARRVFEGIDSNEAVIGHQGEMLETTVHERWARRVLQRAEVPAFKPVRPTLTGTAA